MRRCRGDDWSRRAPGPRRTPWSQGTRRIKSVEDSIRDTDEPEHRLKKHLSGLEARPTRSPSSRASSSRSSRRWCRSRSWPTLVNIGTLFAFVLVSIGVIVLRRTRPDLQRAFRVPLMPVLPIVSALACFWLMLNLPGETWWRFALWMVLGIAIYFVCGRRRSRFTTPGGREDAAAADAARRG